MAYTAIDDPEAYFQVKLTTGSGDAQAVTFDGDSDLDLSSGGMLWGKRRDAAGHHTIFDSVRGITKGLETNNTGAEFTSTDYYTAFGSDGFTIAAGSSGAGNGDTQTASQWCWKESATAGFDIDAYSGTGVARTEAHSLSAVPHLMIVKSRDSTSQNWNVYHHKNTSAPETETLSLNATDATEDNATKWNDTAPTSSVFTIGTSSGINNDGDDFIAYLWSEKQGFSKFGSYTGNGNADGTFVYTGFRPAFILTKRTDSTSHWTLFDNKSLGYNVDNNPLKPNNNESEDTADFLDILSNGYKFRSTDASVNASGGTYIFMAFAEAPFVNSNGVPCNAR